MTAMTRPFMMIFKAITTLIITGFTSLKSLVSMSKVVNNFIKGNT